MLFLKSILISKYYFFKKNSLVIRSSRALRLLFIYVEKLSKITLIFFHVLLFSRIDYEKRKLTNLNMDSLTYRD